MMKALALPSGTAGKSLLILASLVLLVGLVTGEAAAATVSGTVTLDGGVPPTSLTVVATTAAPSYCFLNQGTTSTANGTYSFSLPGTATCSDGSTVTLVAGSSKVLVFVHNSNPQIVSAPNDSIEKSFTYTGTTQTITANFTLVTGKPLEGNVADFRNAPAVGVADVTVFATNGPNQYKFLGQTKTLGPGCTVTCGDYTLFAAAGQQVELAVDDQDPKFVQRFPDGVVDPAFIRDTLLSTSNGCSGTPVAPADEKWCLLFFDIVRAITISGTVSDAGAPSVKIGGARVDAFFVEGADEEIWTWLAETFTASNGSYTVEVPSHLGSVRLTVNKTGYLEGIEDVTWDPAAATDQLGVDIALVPKSVTVKVHVTDASNGDAIAGASVSVGGTVLGTTDNSGDFSFQASSNSSVTIQVSKAGFVSQSRTVAVGITALTENFALEPVPAGADTVTITKAEWNNKNKKLTVWAVSDAQPAVTLTATVVGVGGFTDLPMTFSSRRSRYELQLQVSTNLDGRTVTVTSSGGGVRDRVID